MMVKIFAKIDFAKADDLATIIANAEIDGGQIPDHEAGNYGDYRYGRSRYDERIYRKEGCWS